MTNIVYYINYDFSFVQLNYKGLVHRYLISISILVRTVVIIYIIIYTCTWHHSWIWRVVVIYELQIINRLLIHVILFDQRERVYIHDTSFFVRVVRTDYGAQSGLQCFGGRWIVWNSINCKWDKNRLIKFRINLKSHPFQLTWIQDVALIVHTCNRLLKETLNVLLDLQELTMTIAERWPFSWILVPTFH